MNRYITTDTEADVLSYLDEWKTGRFGKKLTWAMLSKAFGYSRQALGGNARIKAAYDEVKATLKEAASQVDSFDDLEKENKRLTRELAEARTMIHEYQQKYLRWQVNAQLNGVSVATLNKPIEPSLKEELRKRAQKEQEQ